MDSHCIWLKFTDISHDAMIVEMYIQALMTLSVCSAEAFEQQVEVQKSQSVPSVSKTLNN